MVAEKFYYLGLGQDDRTNDFAVDMQKFIVDTLLSKPCTKRMRSKLDGVYSIEEILNGIFSNSNPEQTLTVSNGTYTVTQTVGFWSNHVKYILENFTKDNCKQTGFKKTAESASARDLQPID